MERDIRVLLADDNELFREGLAKLLESHPGITIVSRCDDGAEVVEKAKQTEPDLVLMKIRLPHCDGIEATKRISELLPASNVVILTDSEKEEDLFSAIKAGARGYLLKEIGLDGLTKSVELVAKGEFIVSARLAQKVLDEVAFAGDKKDVGKAESDVGLSEREVEIARLVAKGTTNKEIAEMLVIAENTVKVHVKNILEKLGLRNKQQIAAFAIKHGLATNITHPDDAPPD